MRDIFFKCVGCGEWLAVDRAGAGRLGGCPKCGAKVRVPFYSSLPPRARKMLLLGASYLGLAAVVLLVLQVRLPAPTAAPAGAAASAGSAGAGPAPSAAAAPVRPFADLDASAGAPAAAPARARSLQEENRRLAEENIRLVDQYEGLGNWILRTFRGKYPLPERLLPKLDVAPVTEDYALHPDLQDFLGVNPEEKHLVDDALAATHGAVEQVELSLMTVTQSSAGRITFYVPAYPEAGTKIREDLYRALETSLGGPRFGRMVDAAGKGLEKSYHYFGQASHTLIFERTESADGQGAPHFVIKDGWVIPDGESRRRIEVREASVREIPKDYARYFALLPPDVAEGVLR